MLTYKQVPRRPLPSQLSPVTPTGRSQELVPVPLPPPLLPLVPPLPTGTLPLPPARTGLPRLAPRPSGELPLLLPSSSGKVVLAPASPHDVAKKIEKSNQNQNLFCLSRLAGGWAPKTSPVLRVTSRIVPIFAFDRAL
jgi:hypothetical protein